MDSKQRKQIEHKLGWAVEMHYSPTEKQITDLFLELPPDRQRALLEQLAKDFDLEDDDA